MKLKYLICIFALVVAIIGGFILFSNKPIEKSSDNEIKEKIDSKYKKINDVVYLTNYEVELKDVNFGKQLCYLSYDEDYLLPTENSHYDQESFKELYDYSTRVSKPIITAKDGNVFCVITYKIKNIAKEMVDISSDLRVSPFKVVYNEQYYLTDLSQMNVKPTEIRYTAIRNEKEKFKVTLQTKEDNKIEKNRKWIQKYTVDDRILSQEYYLYPLETKEVREYIEIPEDIYEKYKDNLKIEKSFIKNLAYRGGDMDNGAYESAIWNVN